MAKGSTEELCDYLNVKSAKIEREDSDSKSGSGVSGKLFKHWSSMWVVLHTEISPSFCFIGHCKKESDWLANNKIEKLNLGESFEVEKLPAGYSKKFENVVQVTFKTYRVDLAFDSKTKMELWYNQLRIVNDCFHVDLVRCPQFPRLEGEYVIEVGGTYFKAWSYQAEKDSTVRWEWQLKHLRRVHWHKNVHKLEVEPGRSSQTGEGHFYFTGQHASRLFSVMRHMMTNKSASPSNSSPSTPNMRSSSVPIISPTQQHGRRVSEPSSLAQTMQVNPLYLKVERTSTEPPSEDDWTGDDWTGTSDSGFFVGSKITRPSEVQNHFILPSGPAPPLPNRGPRQETSHYTDINIKTLDPDGEYVQITRQGHVYDTVPVEDGSTTPTVGRRHYHVPRPHLAMSTSQNGISRLSTTDDYCQMNSVAIAREIKRNGSLPLERPPPIPPHQKGVSPPRAWAGPPHSDSATNRH